MCYLSLHKFFLIAPLRDSDKGSLQEERRINATYSTQWMEYSSQLLIALVILYDELDKIILDLYYIKWGWNHARAVLLLRLRNSQDFYAACPARCTCLLQLCQAKQWL